MSGIEGLAPALKARIDDTIQGSKVVLFMKGTRGAPRCGFSASVVEVLDSMVDDYATVDVLADPEIREGIKAYSDWPTIPQLYVDKEFIGGADIVKEMAQSGELQKLLGVPQDAKPQQVDVVVSAAAAKVLAGARAGEPAEHRFLRLEVNARFQHALSFGPELPGDGVTQSEGIDIRVGRSSLKRAQGVRIGYVEGATSGFTIDNPNEPARVKQLAVKELKKLLDEAQQKGEPLRVYDVRTPDERKTASIPGTVLFDAAARQDLEDLPKDTPLYFHCHHGGRSQAAAEQALAQGFTKVWNVKGGIDAWSLEVDSSVPRY